MSECGREKVSDTAEACLGCGYGIRKHFEKEMQQREAKEKQNKIEKEKFVQSGISAYCYRVWPTIYRNPKSTY